MTTKVSIYEKSVTSGSKKFAILKCKTDKQTYDCMLGLDLRKKIDSMGLVYPVDLTLNEGDYFIKKVQYVTNGEKKFKYRVVIVNAHEIAQGKFQGVTFKDIEG